MEQPLAHRMAIPSARIPSAAREAVARIEDLRHLNPPKARDCEKRRRFHIDHYASLALPPRHPRPGLAIHRVSGPGLAPEIVVIVFAQHRLDRSERAPRRRNL